MVWEVCAVETLLGRRGVCTPQLSVCSRSLSYTQWRIRHVWHRHSKYSLALSNWIVNYHFYVQFKKHHKGHAAPETCCKTKFLLLAVCALTLGLEAVPYSVLLLARQTEGRGWFCSRTCQAWAALRAAMLLTHTGRSYTVPGRVTTCCSTGKTKLHLLGLLCSFIYLFKAYVPYSVHPSVCPRDQAVQAHCIFSLFWLGWQRG